MLSGANKLIKQIYSRFLVDIGLIMHRKGSQMTGSQYFNENQTDHKTFFPVEGHKTTAGINTKVAISSQLFGSVQLSDNNIVGIRSVLNAHELPIRLGSNSIVGNVVNIKTQQLDNDQIGSVNIGNNVLIKDKCILKSCQIGNNVMIGERAQIQEGAIIDDNVIIEDDAIINRLQIVPENTVWSGQPAKKIRDLTAEDKDKLQQELKDTSNIYRLMNQEQIFIDVNQLCPFG